MVATQIWIYSLNFCSLRHRLRILMILIVFFHMYPKRFHMDNFLVHVQRNICSLMHLCYEGPGLNNSHRWSLNLYQHFPRRAWTLIPGMDCFWLLGRTWNGRGLTICSYLGWASERQAVGRAWSVATAKYERLTLFLIRTNSQWETPLRSTLERSSKSWCWQTEKARRAEHRYLRIHGCRDARCLLCSATSLLSTT